jgi:DNA-binding LacI/PurR family transcriptional regulator
MDIREVAKRAKVSTATVSRTINKPGSVTAKTAERVWKVIHELRYFPNTHARSLVSGRSRILGILVSDVTNPFFPELIQGFDDLAMEHGYELLINSTRYDPVRMALAVKRMLERTVEGIAIMTSEMDPLLTEQIALRHVPMTFLDVGQEGEGVSNIIVDYERGVGEAVAHLLDLGHTKVAFIGGPLTLKSAMLRRMAFLHCLHAGGIIEDQRQVVTGDHTIDGGFQAMQELLACPVRPTAVLCSNDLTAMGALRAVRRAGLRVPGEISIIGFDDIHLAEFTEPPLTTVRLSREELARKAFYALLGHIQGTSESIQASQTESVSHDELRTVTTKLVVRESTGPMRLS